MEGEKAKKRSTTTFRRKKKQRSGPYPFEFRLHTVRMHLEEGYPASLITAELGISKETLTKWTKRYQQYGEAGLQNLKRGSKRSRLPGRVKDKIIQLKRSNPGFGSRRIADMLKRLFLMPASSTTVHTTLSKEDLIPKGKQKRKKNPAKPRFFERSTPNQLWQSDILTFRLGGQNAYLIGFMDDYSRFMTGLGLYRSQTAENVLEVYRRAIGEYGVSKEMLTDNGRQYTNWRGTTRFEQELKKERVRHIKSRPHHPMTLGKVERFWKTMLEEFVLRAQFGSFEEARERVRLWVQYYNHKRPHQGIGGLCPADRFFEINHELKKTLEKEMAENVLEMALRGKARDPFYMVGRMGDQSVVATMEGIKATYHTPVCRLARQMGLSYDSLMRWKRRIRNGQNPVNRPGPKKVEPLDFTRLQADIHNLKHARKRTHATGALYQHYRNQVSRRQLGTMVAEARMEHRRKMAGRMQRITWRYPDLAWALDGSTPKTEHPLTVYRVQDLCSHYTFPPVAGASLPCGEELSGHLERLFSDFAVPLFCKRDNEGILNHHAVNEVLEQHLVIPLNSPTYYAPYNGAIEHTQGALNRSLRDWSWKAQSSEGLMLLTELGSHDHNHLPRRSLRGKNACRAYFGSPRVTFDKRRRKEVFLWIKQATFDMMETLGDDGMFMTAWRIAARTWLHKNHYITIVRNGKVLPYYS